MIVCARDLQLLFCDSEAGPVGWQRNQRWENAYIEVRIRGLVFAWRWPHDGEAVANNQGPHPLESIAHSRYGVEPLVG